MTTGSTRESRQLIPDSKLILSNIINIINFIPLLSLVSCLGVATEAEESFEGHEHNDQSYDIGEGEIVKK